MGVDWITSLRRASYRGAPFFVETDDWKVGRRLVVHQFPNRDRPYVEDLGEEAQTYSVTAYLASDNVIAQKNALMSACRRRGAGTLMLPTEGGRRVRCHSAQRTHSLDKLGYIAFSLDFVESGRSRGASPIAYLERLVSVAASNALDPLRNAFLTTFNTLRKADYVFADATERVEEWAETFDAFRMQWAMDADLSSDLDRGLQMFHARASTYAKDGRDQVAVSQTALGLASQNGDGGTIVDDAFALTELFRQAITLDQDKIDALSELAQYNVDETGITFFSRTGGQQEDNRIAINSLVRRVALLSLAVATAEADWPDRGSAITARANVVELFDRELHATDGGTEAFQFLSEARGRAAAAVSEKIADLDPIVVVDANAVMPSIVWAYRLYEDASQADDLSTRNRVAHPGYMPRSFEALTPLHDAPEDHVSDKRRRTGVI